MEQIKICNVNCGERTDADFDVVERPQHYVSTSIECIDA